MRSFMLGIVLRYKIKKCFQVLSFSSSLVFSPFIWKCSKCDLYLASSVNKILGWPKGSFVFFCKMALVALSCL